MAIEGITGAASTYQASQTGKVQTAKPETVKPVESYTDSNVGEISRDTRIVKNAGDTEKDGGQNNNDSRQPSDETMKQALSDINKRLSNTECIFGVHDKTNRVTIRIVDKDTKEVIKEVPPEKTLDMIAKVWELAGILVDEKL
ncbi:MAG: flagellar protein FlaG [Lachnospiraceae bacterium]|nr:flagellar protein FlaG [Lachnospiraceae bacterium]